MDKALFRMLSHNGDFVQFTAVPRLGDINEHGNVPVSLQSVAILERGNIYTPQESD